MRPHLAPTRSGRLTNDILTMSDSSQSIHEPIRWTAAALAERLGGEVVGDGEREVTGIAAIEDAGQDDLTFIAGLRYTRFHEATRAGVVLVPVDFDASRTDLTYIRCPDSFSAFIDAVALIVPPPTTSSPGVHATAVVDSSAAIGAQVSIGPYTVVEAGCVVGAGTVLGSHVTLGRGSRVGADCLLHAGVRVYHDCAIGDRAVLHSGATIGADGFGFQPLPDGTWRKVPQVGRVEIGNDVEIGANTTIDRATLGATRIGNGVKLDNLIHIAHNVTIGDNTVIAAQAGVAGSARLGARNMVAGQVGFVGHIETVDGVIVEAGSGVSKSITAPGRYFGHPAREHALALRQEGALRQLPDLLIEIRDLRRRIEELERITDSE